MPSGSTSTWNFALGVPPWPGNGEIDLDQHRGAADAHGRDRRVDLHVAMLGGLAGDEGDGAGDQAEQRGIVRPVGVVDHLVQHHPRIRRQAEHGAVDEGDAERGVRAGLDHVAFFDVVAHVEDDRDAVADRGRAARQLGDVADHRAGGAPRRRPGRPRHDPVSALTRSPVRCAPSGEASASRFSPLK